MASTIKVGDTIPQAVFGYNEVSAEDSLMTCQRPGQVSTDSWKGKKIVLVGIPGSFTPTCTERHLPPYVEQADKIKAKGVDDIYCIATNDQFVQAAYAKASGAAGKVKYISDPLAAWLTKTGLSLDMSSNNFGTRSNRFALIIDDLVVKYVGLEPSPQELTVSSVDSVLAKL